MRVSEKLVAAVAFVTALGATLVVLPLATDNPALALDADAFRDSRTNLPSLSRGEQVEAHIAAIRTALRITSAQTAQWNMVAEVMRRQAAAIMRLRAKDRASLTMLDRIELRRRVLEQRAADLSELLAAATPLYAALSPDQKKDADALILARSAWSDHAQEGGLTADGAGLSAEP